MGGGGKGRGGGKTRLGGNALKVQLKHRGRGSAASRLSQKRDCDFAWFLPAIHLLPFTHFTAKVIARHGIACFTQVNRVQT
jgi:hypothetical protein